MIRDSHYLEVSMNAYKIIASAVVMLVAIVCIIIFVISPAH